MIKRFIVTNFKSLSKVDVEFDPVTVIIGRSGTGKSNLIDAVRFLSDFVSLKFDAFGKANKQWDKIYSLTGPSGSRDHNATIRFVIIFNIPSIEGDFTYDLVLALKHGGSLHIASEMLFVDGKPIFEVANGVVSHSPFQAKFPKIHGLAIEQFSGDSIVNLAYLMLTEGYCTYDFGGDILKNNTRPDKSQNQGRGLVENGTNFIQAFSDLSSDLHDLNSKKEIVAAVRMVNHSVDGIELVMPDRNRIVVNHSVDGQRMEIGVDQESEGFRRFLAHLLALYQKPPRQAILFEEPEKGLYPGALTVLADNIKACTQNGRGQVIITTHNPDLLRHFPPEQIRVATIEQFATKIGRIAPEQVESIRENLMTSGELLTVDLARVREDEDR